MSTERGYDDYMALRGTLAEALTALGGELGALGAPERAERLASAREALLRDAFRLMVLGEFKRGKSTLINAMLGRDVLPARVAPCTAVITEVSHGLAPKAVLYPRDEQAPPQEVPVDRLREFITVGPDDDDDDDESAPAAASPWRKLELSYPLPLLERNVAIVDSPGLNEHLTRTRLALDYLASADAVVVVLSCQQALSASELTFIDRELAGRNLRHAFFVWNHLDTLENDPQALADIQQRSDAELDPRIGSSDRVYFLSARDALIARKQDQPAPAAFTDFEGAIETFLATERGRVKLLTPLRAAEQALGEARNHLLVEREALATTSLRDLETRLAQERPRLEGLEARRERLLATIERRREAVVVEATASYQRFVAESVAVLPEALKAVDVGVLESLISRSRAQGRLDEELSRWFDARVQAWQTETLEPLVERQLQALERDLDEQARAFYAELAGLNAALVPELAVRASTEADVAPVDRLLSAAGGFFLGGVGAAIEGASVGFRGMSRGLIFHVGLSAGLIALGLGMPVVLPVLAAVGVGRTLWEAQHSVDKMRDRVAREVSGQLSTSVPTVSAGLAARLTGQFDRLLNAVDAGVKLAQEEAVGVVQALVLARREGETRVEAERAELKAVRERLATIERALTTVRFELEARA